MQSAPNTMETWFGFIRSIDDAVTVVEAARTGYLPRVTRRLTEDERMVLIRSGSVFVFEESESQVRRWADSRNWSSSRMKGYFLVYSEQEVSRSAPGTGDEPDQDAAAAAASRTANTLLHHGGQTLNKRDSAISLLSRRSSASTLASLHDVVPARPLLKKKALSLTTAFGNKLRLISYYAEADVAEGILPTPDNDPLLTKIQVPDGLYYAGNDGPIALSKTSTTRQPLPGPGHAMAAPDVPASTMQQQHQVAHEAPQQPVTAFALTPPQPTSALAHAHQPIALGGPSSYAMHVDQPAFVHQAPPAVSRGPPPPAPLSLPHPSHAVADMGHPPVTSGPFGTAPATHQPDLSFYPSEPVMAPAHEEAAPIPRRGLRTAISLEQLSSTTTVVGRRRLSQSASLGHLPHLSMSQASSSAGSSPRMGHTRTPSAGSITIPKSLKRRSDPLPQFVWRGPSTSSFTAAPTIPEAPPVHETAMHSPMSIVSRQLSPMDTDEPPAPATPEPAAASMRRRSLYDPVIAAGAAAAAAEAASRRHSVHLGVALDRPMGDWRVSARYDRTVHAEDARQLRALDRSFNL
ncbi:hypothetical protein AMAG_16224 [Allomyces macrogynus ATCC 38327]|uniref:Gti1/Pac2 family-domain-containing protein n=1 Tax=Allomyces macrogynus (strain ATCC 38327) TaxID=578462 RepID=A0A0L0TAD7_ALLM3|nr:hypothetical protein AMAG_16224 [Allomyces macrogynus ATCC 38327]|eukprot:KNE71670.1 hypothetical protein AMAG_16224 [Allomyces macrogynus ATCC 38327]